MKFLLKYLKEFEKNKTSDEINKKIIILLIHLIRKNEPYNKDIFVSNSLDIPQTFIDDIYGKEILINDVLNLNIKELFNKLFKNNLYNSFRKIQYKFQDNIINEYEYIFNILKSISNNEELINIIIKRITKEMNKSQKPLKICEYIFQDNAFETRNDFINRLINELEKEFIEWTNSL